MTTKNKNVLKAHLQLFWCEKKHTDIKLQVLIDGKHSVPIKTPVDCFI